MTMAGPVFSQKLAEAFKSVIPDDDVWVTLIAWFDGKPYEYSPRQRSAHAADCTVVSGASRQWQSVDVPVVSVGAKHKKFSVRPAVYSVPEGGEALWWGGVCHVSVGDTVTVNVSASLSW